MNRKFHISKDMFLRIVIGILNVNLMRKKDQQGEPEEKRREKRRGSTTNRNEKQGPGYSPATMVGSKCSTTPHNNTFSDPQVHSADVIREYL